MPLPVTEAKCAESGAFLAMSDYDASLTVPGAQKVDAGPDCRGKVSQVESDAAACGKLSQSLFGDCTFDDKASEDLVENMTRDACSYELVHGLERSSSQLRQGWWRASAFFPDTPSCCAAPAWTLCKMFQDGWMVKHLAAQPLRMYGSPADAPELRGSSGSSGFPFQYAARAQALSQLLVFKSLLPTAPLGIK